MLLDVRFYPIQHGHSRQVILDLFSKLHVIMSRVLVNVLDPIKPQCNRPNRLFL